MDTTDITVQILREIRDEIRGTREEARGTNARLDALETTVNSRLGAIDDRLGLVEGRLVDIDSSITSMHRDLNRLRPIGDGDALVKRVARCERDIADLKARSR